MIRATVTAQHEIIVEITVVGPQRPATLQAVVDTGFAGALAIPESLAISLGLIYLGPRDAQLANDEIVPMEEYAGDVIWDGERRTVQILATNGSVLVGMDLLYGHDLTARLIDGGEFVLTRIP